MPMPNIHIHPAPLLRTPPLPLPRPAHQPLPIPADVLGPEASHAARLVVLDLDRGVGPAHQALPEEIDAVPHVRRAAHEREVGFDEGLVGERGGEEEGVRVPDTVLSAGGGLVGQNYVFCREGLERHERGGEYFGARGIWFVG